MFHDSRSKRKKFLLITNKTSTAVILFPTEESLFYSIQTYYINLKNTVKSTIPILESINLESIVAIEHYCHNCHALLHDCILKCLIPRRQLSARFVAQFGPYVGEPGVSSHNG